MKQVFGQTKGQLSRARRESVLLPGCAKEGASFLTEKSRMSSNRSRGSRRRRRPSCRRPTPYQTLLRTLHQVDAELSAVLSDIAALTQRGEELHLQKETFLDLLMSEPEDFSHPILADWFERGLLTVEEISVRFPNFLPA